MAKGRKTGGRKKGTPNHVTTETRELFKRLFDGLAPEVEGWIRRTAEEDPARAADLMLRLAEFYHPKLARIEKTIADATDDELLAEVRRRVAMKAADADPESQ